MAPNEPNPPEEKTVEWLQHWLYRTSDNRFIPDPRLIDFITEYKRCKRKEGIPFKNQQELMEMLFPTRYWTENGIRYKQKVSTEQVTRKELKEMNEQLNEQLRNKQSQLNARYCPIRFSLHMEMFDEIRREVALVELLRAFMLERVRGELNQTLDAYKKVLEVSLVEEAKVVVDRRVDPEVIILQKRLDDAEADLASIMEEHESALSDLKDVELKFELMERIQDQVHGPEIEFTKGLGKALELQLFHFDNPPTFDTGDEEKKFANF